MQNRYFLAIDLNDHVKERVKVLQHHVKLCEVDVKLVEPENLHFTVQFLGNLDKTQVSRVIKTLKPLLEVESPSNVSVQGMGYFGPSSFPGVIWVGVGPEKPYLIGLFSRISAVLNDLGLVFKEKEHIPHITIGRMRTNNNINKLKEIISKECETSYGETPVNAVKLKASVLTSEGPKYTDVEIFDLKKS